MFEEPVDPEDPADPAPASELSAPDPLFPLAASPEFVPESLLVSLPKSLSE